MKKILMLFGLLFALSACAIDYSYSTTITYQNNSGADVTLVAYVGEEQYKFEFLNGASIDVLRIDGSVERNFDIKYPVFDHFLSYGSDADSVQLIFDGQRALTYHDPIMGLQPTNYTVGPEKCKCFYYGTFEFTPEMREAAVPIGD